MHVVDRLPWLVKVVITILYSQSIKSQNFGGAVWLELKDDKSMCHVL